MFKLVRTKLQESRSKIEELHRIKTNIKMRFFFISFLLVTISQFEAKAQYNFTKTRLLYEDNFKTVDPNDWISELQVKSGSFVGMKNGRMEIDIPKGATIWFSHKLKGNILIEYEATVINEGGPNDRVSDLNCFWMATDPGNPKDIFNSPRKASGKFNDYDVLQLYYVGMGGHHNTKTRFRRYDGTGAKPLLPEHDLSDPEVLIEPNRTYTIRLVAMGKQIQFYRDDQLIYDFRDESPYTQGWFGFRTVNNHMTVDNFKVYRIKKNEVKIYVDPKIEIK